MQSFFFGQSYPKRDFNRKQKVSKHYTNIHSALRLQPQIIFGQVRLDSLESQKKHPVGKGGSMNSLNESRFLSPDQDDKTPNKDLESRLEKGAGSALAGESDSVVVADKNVDYFS